MKLLRGERDRSGGEEIEQPWEWQPVRTTTSRAFREQGGKRRKGHAAGGRIEETMARAEKGRRLAARRKGRRSEGGGKRMERPRET